jgi:hypothetical protein
MTLNDTVNVLLVDDQPAKLLAYEVILQELGENLIKTASAREAFEYLLKNDVAVILLDVCMPELDGFQLAAMIREHPRFQKTAIIFISAIHLTFLPCSPISCSRVASTFGKTWFRRSAGINDGGCTSGTHSSVDPRIFSVPKGPTRPAFSIRERPQHLAKEEALL